MGVTQLRNDAAARKLTIQKLLLLCMLNALADDTKQAGTTENHYKAGLNIGKRIDGKQHWFYIPPLDQCIMSKGNSWQLHQGWTALVDFLVR